VFSVISQQTSPHWERDVRDELDAMVNTLSLTSTDIDLGQVGGTTADSSASSANSSPARSSARSSSSSSGKSGPSAGSLEAGPDSENAEQKSDDKTAGKSLSKQSRWLRHDDAPPFTIDKSSREQDEDRWNEVELDEGASGTTRR